MTIVTIGEVFSFKMKLKTSTGLALLTLLVSDFATNPILTIVYGNFCTMHGDFVAFERLLCLTPPRKKHDYCFTYFNFENRLNFLLCPSFFCQTQRGF